MERRPTLLSYGTHGRRLLSWLVIFLVHCIVAAGLVKSVPVQNDKGEQVQGNFMFLLQAKNDKALEPPIHIADQRQTRTSPARKTRGTSYTTQRLARRLSTGEDTTATVILSDENSTTAGVEPQDDPPRFDMAAARAIARTAVNSRDGMSQKSLTADAVLNTSVDEKLGRDIERARRKDCQTQYAGLGLLAVAPLLLDTVTGAKCKWK